MDALTMTNDEAQDWLLAQHNAAPGPPDPARFGAAIRAIRAKAIADAKELYGDFDTAWTAAEEAVGGDGSLSLHRLALDGWYEAVAFEHNVGQATVRVQAKGRAAALEELAAGLTEEPA